jgi:hypothetical protein
MFLEMLGLEKNTQSLSWEGTEIFGGNDWEY